MSLISKLLIAVGLRKPQPLPVAGAVSAPVVNWMEVCREGTGPERKSGRVSYRGKISGVHEYSVCDLQMGQLPDLVSQLKQTFRTNDIRVLKTVQGAHNALTLVVFSHYDNKVCVARVTLLRSASTIAGGSVAFKRRVRRAEFSLWRLLVE